MKAAAHWLILAAIVGACVVIERASTKIEHALIIAAYYQADNIGRINLPLDTIFPERYIRGDE